MLRYPPSCVHVQDVMLLVTAAPAFADDAKPNIRGDLGR
jgi:hypothetical protein